MSDKAKRNVVRIGVPGVALLAVVAAGVGLWQGQVPPATAQEAPSTQPVREALDELTYSRVRELRERVGLTNGAVAGMGLTQAQAETVLEGVLAWYEANQAAWDARRGAVGAGKRELGEAVRRVHAGRANEGLRAAVLAASGLRGGGSGTRR